ncbi:MAG: glycerol-3-phosphate dehydrogenase [Betaproteobacteria bacterium]|nr:glycerol-3-phosphate dehydrogenase [Betaproteobacteria bacterium]MDH5341205.1 glycerol-3-phosphate dehydrogenase [Betaproteobacteria bacterium]
MSIDTPFDLLVVGGGINGVGIARDAAGRGLSVLLVEKNDLGGATSSASSKLIHGGLRYLEQFEFRLVAEALHEREVLLRAAPHLVHPMRFVMPHVAELRPAWMIRVGLFLYDVLARRQTLPGSASVRLSRPPYNNGLNSALDRGFIYSDCWVDDARLVIATARSAAACGASIRTRTACTALYREARLWRVTLQPAAGPAEVVSAKTVINVAGPWAKSFLTDVAALDVPFGLRLVQGSHIVVPRLYEGDHAFILQNDDHRVIFAYPYESHYTLVGTTDVELPGTPEQCAATTEEVRYLCRAVNRYFRRSITEEDVVHRYAGIRPLFDDGAGNPSQVTRDYVLRMTGEPGTDALLSVFGGKITTYRRLAEEAVDAMRPWFPRMKARWTAHAPLDGGDLGAGGLVDTEKQAARDYPWLRSSERTALVRRHGANLPLVMAGAASLADLGTCFGPGLYAREVDWFITEEWATTAEDVLWRRTKCGLHLTPTEQHAVAAYMMQRVS